MLFSRWKLTDGVGVLIKGIFLNGWDEQILGYWGDPIPSRVNPVILSSVLFKNWGIWWSFWNETKYPLSWLVILWRMLTELQWKYPYNKWPTNNLSISSACSCKGLSVCLPPLWHFPIVILPSHHLLLTMCSKKPKNVVTSN